MFTMTYQNSLNDDRKSKDQFFKNSDHSPLTPDQRASFTAMSYYLVDQNFRFEVELKLYSVQNDVDIVTSKGNVEMYKRFGYVEFEVDSKLCSLTIYKQSNDDYLFVPFKDSTSGKETYGAGRYVELEKLADKKYILDFNLAYNPYCAYNDNWVCPLTPFENNLKVEIKSGEKNYKN